MYISYALHKIFMKFPAFNTITHTCNIRGTCLALCPVICISDSQRTHCM